MPRARVSAPGSEVRTGDFEWLDGGVTAVPGILAGGVAAGIKPSGKKDLALIHSPTPAHAAAVFTTNQVKGASVLVSMEHSRGGVAQAIVASSGCANVCTGEQGLRDAREITRLVGELLRIPARHVLIGSTGTIGPPLPMDRIRSGLPRLVKSLSPQGSRAAAEGIMTTDTRPKEAALRLEVGGRPVTLGAVAKGAGMVEPHMATMFCFVTTDAVVSAAVLRRALKQSVDRSLNRITVDGDQSTSDTVAVLANGLAENVPLEGGGRGFHEFASGLDALCQRMARLLVQDGEGATKLVAVAVRGAATGKDAVLAARSVANSPLVKTAINGQDPNWGRIMMALGKSPARVDPERVAILIDDEPLVERGTMRAGARLDRVREIMGRAEYVITIDLGLGRSEDRVWTCDLSEEYVRINAKYTT